MNSGDVGEPGEESSASLGVESPQPAPARSSRPDLSGRVAVVTGGGWNIGRAVALAIGRAGARVIVTSRQLENLERTVELGRREALEMRCFAADLTDPRAVEELFADVRGREGPVDVLACLAGGFGAAQPLPETDPGEWLAVLLRNLYATYLCCRAALPGMLERRRGDILTCAGGGAFFPMVDAHATAYGSAKAAVCRFTDQLYAEHMKTPGLRINCIEPGLTLNSDELKRIEDEERRTGRVHPAREHNHDPAACAELALFLLSPAARGINGRILSVDDDWWRDPDRVNRILPTDFYRLRRTFPS